MSRPLSPLVEIAAAGADVQDVHIGPPLVRSALEHGMQGLLQSVLLDGRGQAAPREASDLASESLRVRDHTLRLWAVWSEVETAAAAVGVHVAGVKGPAAESRWYGRLGERPCVDLDLWLAPPDRSQLPGLIRSLDPGHALLDEDLGPLIEQSQLQSVQLAVDGISVDLHIDVLKLGVPSRLNSVLWDRAVRIEAPDGEPVTVLDPVGALLHHLLHLNKDRFRRLLGLADVARILDCERPDLRELEGLARQGGLEIPVLCSLHAVVDELGLDIGRLPEAHGPRSKAWSLLWPERIRLAGDLGRASYRYRQELLPFLLRGPGRARMAVARLGRDLFPSRALVAYRNPDISGGYLRRLTLGRLRRWRLRRRSIRQAKGGGER